jgi:hypothetical protein
MLHENEYAEVSRLYSQCMDATKEFRQRWQVPLAQASTNAFARVGTGTRS